MDKDRSTKREAYGGRLAARLKSVLLRYGFGLLVLLLAAGILSKLCSCVSYDKGGLVLETSMDIAPQESARAEKQVMAPEADVAGVAFGEAAGGDKESRTSTIAEQVSGVWGQPAQAQELSATGRKPMIVYNGDLEVKVSQLKEAADNALKLIEQYQGYMSNMQEYNYETSQSVSITARIPAVKVIQFAEDVKRLGEMISSRLTGDEVTEEYFDLQARLEALRISEERLKEMLSRSGKLSDLLEIERELSNKQSQIEQVEGRMRYLKDRSAMATLNISLVTEAPPSPAIVSFTWDFGQVFSQAWMNLKYSVRGFLHGLIYFIVNAVFWIPVLLVIWLILWLIWRWLRKSGIIEWEPISKKDERGP